MTRTDLEQAVARAIMDADWCCVVDKHGAQKMARAALSAIGEAGYMVVPRQADPHNLGHTESMIDLGKIDSPK